ncbi:MAG: HNH endonuclease, partial [Propionibacteriales bacterium]|nr:HNH endonuclease [Propionibacteriales bacterium]
MSSGLIDDFTAATGHPLVRFADAVEALLDDAASANAWTMTPTELRAVLPRLSRAGSRLTEVTLRVLAEADRQSIGDDVGATNTPAWFAHVTGQPVPAAHAQVKLAATLDQDRHQATRDALAAGRLNPTQATVVLDAVEALPAELVDPALAADAEAHLVSLGDLDAATRLDPKALRIAGRKILEVLAPAIAEAHEAKVLEAEERHAAATATFTMRPDGHGSMLGKFKIPLLHGQILAKHLDALAAPKHQCAIAKPGVEPVET